MGRFTKADLRNIYTHKESSTFRNLTSHDKVNGRAGFSPVFVVLHPGWMERWIQDRREKESR
jgi:hypothetical protein